MVRGLISGLEEAFGVRLAGDLRHVRTAGDLFETIQASRPIADAAEHDATRLAFHALRRSLAPYWLEESPTAATPLRGKDLPLPRRLKKLLEAKTGYALPKPAISMFGWLAAGALGICAAYAITTGATVVGVACLIAAVALLLLDPGEFSGDYATLGSLVGEVTAMNFAERLDRAAGVAEEERWRRFADIVARHADPPVDPRLVDRDTPLRAATVH